MIVQYLWIAGSLPFIILGIMHLLYTFFTNKFSCRNKLVDYEMKRSFPVLTNKTSMWKAWIGFNGSHSSGCIYIGLINLFTGIQYPSVIHNPVFLLLNIITVSFYLWLAKKYWFRIPFTGVATATICFTVATILVIID